MTAKRPAKPKVGSLVALGLARFEELCGLADEPRKVIRGRPKAIVRTEPESEGPLSLSRATTAPGEAEKQGEAGVGLIGLSGATTAPGEASRLGAITAEIEPHRRDFEMRRAVVAVLRAAAFGLVPAEAHEGLRHFRLFDDAFCQTANVPVLPPFAEVPAASSTAAVTPQKKSGTLAVNGGAPENDPEGLGQLLEALLSQEGLRKQRGRFYTPRAVVDDVVSRAMSPFLKDERAFPRVIDPACGGGAFLFGVARALLSRVTKTEGIESDDRSQRRAIFDVLHGHDIEPLAVAVTEIALAIWASALSDVGCLSRSRFVATDSLLGAEQDGARDSAREVRPALISPGKKGLAHFDLVIGNPPWVAYAGRATQPLAPERRRWLTENYAAFRGYPTLQACFVELATRLTPRGRIALLVPSAVADLDGYRPMRRVLSKHHRVSEELVEYGQDAFDGVVQPCFALIADADDAAVVSDAPFLLVERSGIDAQAKRVEPPEVLTRLRQLAPFSAECFRELGFQTTTVVTKTLLLRSAKPSPPFALPLLEGRDVNAFVVGEPKLFLNPDSDVLRSARCRLRHPGEYQAVDFVIRQTAKYPIAALHSGHAFRNSLIAGFGCDNHPPSVLVGLLNSTLLRALHLAEQRDGRQKTFPQVKLLHLRSLPAPPRSAEAQTEFEKLVQSLSGSVPSREECRRLDALVFGWYGVPADEAAAVERFFVERS